MQMISIGNYLYRVTNNQIQKINIKTRTKKLITFERSHFRRYIRITSKYIVHIIYVGKGYSVKIFDTENRNLVTEYVFFKIAICDPRIVILDNFLVFFGSYKNMIYDLNTGSLIVQKNSIGAVDILILLNQILIISKNKLFHCKSVPECIDILKGNIIKHSSIIENYCYFHVDMKVIIGIHTIFGYVHNMEIYNEKLELEYQINILHQKIYRHMSETDAGIMNIVVIENIIYFWDHQKILAINGSKITIIKSGQNIAYNSYHNCFVGNDLTLFKIVDNKMVRYKIQSDYWRDANISDITETIMQILIVCDIFPCDVLNNIYQNITWLDNIDRFVYI